MKDKICQDCESFVQHYGISDDAYHWVNCGFCTVQGRPKHRRAFSRICDRFVPRETACAVPRRTLIATIERLRSILDMELPPEESSREG